MLRRRSPLHFVPRHCARPREASFKMHLPALLIASALCLGAAADARAADGHATVATAATAASASPGKGSKGAPAVAVKDEEAALQKLRERLAEKLGASKTTEQRQAGLQVGPQAGLVRAVARMPDEHSAPTVKPKAKPALAREPVKGAASAAHALTAPHWSYSGEAGPKAWGGLRADFSQCATGTRQSPIDIRDGISLELDPVQFDYRASNFRVIDNGHTVQVNVDPGNYILSGGRRFELLQFHFHRPSEERIDGRSFDMVAHLVHKDSDGRLAVVAVLLDRGSAQPVVQTVWNNLPLEKNEEFGARAVIDLNQLLPADRGYYTYMGSLTTPPCSEGVLWLVMRQPVGISTAQIDIFSRLYPMNARPVQQASGRMIKQSN